MPKIYHYDPITAEFLTDADAHMDPLEGHPLVPGCATLTAPPEVTPGHVAVWADGVWRSEIDLRGTEYWLADGTHHVISEIGVTRPSDALDAPAKLPVRRTQEQAIAAAYAWIESFVHRHVDGGKPPSEISAYPGRELAARAILAGTETPDQRQKLLKLLTFEGKTPAEAQATLPALVSRIIDLADARNEALALTTAMRQQVEAIVASADAVADPFAYDKALAQAALDAQAAWDALRASGA